MKIEIYTINAKAFDLRFQMQNRIKRNEVHVSRKNPISYG